MVKIRGDGADKLFHKPGYVSVREYLNDILRMQKAGPWQLPLRYIDRMQLVFLAFLLRISWFSERISIVHTQTMSPAYSILVEYLRKKKFFDTMVERSLRYTGYYSYFLIKTVSFGKRTVVIRGQGAAEDPATALSKALGEMIERVISGLYDHRPVARLSSFREMRERFPLVYPPRHHRFLALQEERFAMVRPQEDYPLAWVVGRNLITREKTYIPRDMTSWCARIRPENTRNPILIHATTNGAAGYFTREGAVLRGLLEVVQRDGFLVHWLTMIPPNVIRQETLPVDMREKIGKFTSIGVTVFLLDITALPIPSVLVVAMNAESEVPSITLTAATALTFGEAIRDALVEMVVGIEAFSYPDPSGTIKYGETEFEPFVSHLDKMARQFYWRGADRVKRFSWFLEGKHVSYDEICRCDVGHLSGDADRLDACLRTLKMFGSDYYPVVYYPKNAVQETLGFFVAQVYIPKAFPLYLFEGYGTFDSDRLREFAVSKGVCDWKLNPWPHGFP